MKEKNKYYTPKLEEFHIGFKYEFQYIDHNDWIKDSLEYNLLYDHDLDSVFEETKNGRLRVKYLDQEDIEELGWKIFPHNILINKLSGNESLNFYFNTQYVGHRLSYSQNTGTITITNLFYSQVDRINEEKIFKEKLKIIKSLKS